jgi:hypothetical protein
MPVPEQRAVTPTSPTNVRTETAANVLTIATCCISLVLVAAHYSRTRLVDSHASVRVYRVGDLIDATVGLPLREASPTLLLALRADCGYCASSLPFYRSLLAELRVRSTSTTVVVVSRDVPETLERYLKSKDVKPDGIVQVKAGSLRIAKTPTVILLNSKAQIVGIWEGLLSPTQESEVRSLVFTTGR